MKPKRLSVIIITAFMVSSCVRYQYMTMSSNLPKAPSNGFVHENDTCAVSYSFNGANCPLVINVNNKLSEPLYVDWQKSSVTIFRDKMSLWDGSAEDYNSEAVSKILPKSSIGITPLNLMTKLIELTPSDSFRRVQVMTSNGAVTMKKFVFDTISTPLHFKCKLHYSVFKNVTEEQCFEDQFWVSSLISTYSSFPYDQPDIFYLQKSTGFSTFMGIVVVGGLIILNAYLPDEGE